MKKQTPLVTQHLETVSRKFLEEYQDAIKGFVKNRQGVYALYRRGKLYYVGLASNLRSRLGHHLKDRHQASWDRFSVYLTIGDGHLRELEALILRIVDPPGNKVKGKFAKSENLNRKLTKQWKLGMQETLNELLGCAVPKPKRKPVAKPTRGRKPVMADYISKSMRIRGTHKGKTLRATIRQSGVIAYDKQLFTSPSLAAAKAVGRRTCNGWAFWHYERSPGDWVPLSKLRDR
ncbi:MAG: GIY-YIG nuclease family protein [Verrucomicrobia bacterium]|nr:GIY-YIG nuclease family protein [Verrucomicrobiota bacterium]